MTTSIVQFNLRAMTVFASDRALLDAFRRGDRAALTTVYFHYIDELATIVRHGFALPESGARVRGAVDDQAANDLLQDIFARAFAPRARLAYDGIRPYGAYLRRIAKNLMIDRARASDPTIPLDDDSDIVAGEPPHDEDDADWATQRRETVAYLATLSAELQRLVVLRFEHEQSQDQTAAALGISRRRVRTLEARIQKGLRKALRKAGLLAQKDRPVPALARRGTR